MKHIKRSSDEWGTPQWLYDKLNEEFHFLIDLCATHANSKALWHFKDYLNNKICKTNDVPARPWSVFMNPPYSNPYPFVKKAFDDSKNGRMAATVCLIKCDPSTKTWGVFWDYNKHQPKPGVEIRYLPKRLKFERDGVPGDSAPFPSVIVIMRHINA